MLTQTVRVACCFDIGTWPVQLDRGSVHHDAVDGVAARYELVSVPRRGHGRVGRLGLELVAAGDVVAAMRQAGVVQVNEGRTAIGTYMSCNCSSFPQSLTSCEHTTYF